MNSETDYPKTGQRIGLDYLEVTLGADGAGIKVRQILKKKLEQEGRSLT